MAKAAELMKVIPTVVTPAAYVAVYLSGEPAELFARTYDAEGAILAEVGGPWTDPGVSLFPFDHACFVRGSTEGSLAGCAVAFGDLYILDLEALDVVTVATTHRPAEGGGFTWRTAIRADGSVFREGGVLSAIVDEGGSGVGFTLFTRQISADGQTITAGGTVSGHPLDGESPNDAIDTEGIFPVGTGAWGTIARAYDSETSPEAYPVIAWTITDAGSGAEIADREASDGEGSTNLTATLGMVLGSSVGGPLTRIAVDTGGPFAYQGATSRYLAEPLFNLTGFTPQSSSVSRDGTVLVWQADGASRICTWDGSGPIGDADDVPGPTFAGDFGGTETLLWLFGL